MRMYHNLFSHIPIYLVMSLFNMVIRPFLDFSYNNASVSNLEFHILFHNFLCAFGIDS